MTLTFKTAVAALAFAAGFASTASAQTGVTRLTVPYQFHACGKVLPAGTYDIRADASWRNIQITEVGGEACFAPIMVNYAASARERTRITFHVYENVGFLTRVHVAGSGEGLELFPAPAEKEYAARSGAPRIVAFVGAAR